MLIEHLPDGDINSARNAVAAQASCDWLCFLDADDELHPGFVQAMNRAQAIPRAGRTLYTPAVSKVKAGRGGGPARFYPQVDLRWGNWLIIGTLIEREFFLELGGFRDWPHGLEDWDLWARAHYAGATPIKVPRAVYVQHIHGQSSHARFASNKEVYQRTREAVIASHSEGAP